MTFALGDEKFLFEYLRWNSYLSSQYKLLYVATPKVACTTLKWWFASIEGYSKDISAIIDSGESDIDLMIHDSFHKVAPHVTGLKPENLSEALESPECFRFAVVRNPFKKLFSAWQSKILLREPLQIAPYLELGFANLPIRNFDDIQIAFEGFVEHLVEREEPVFWDVHWTPQVDLLRPDFIDYSCIGKVENTSELMPALKNHIASDVPNPFVNRKKNESLIPFSQSFVTERAAGLIRKLYAKDFKKFDYQTDVPSAELDFSKSQLETAVHAVNLKGSDTVGQEMSGY